MIGLAILVAVLAMIASTDEHSSNVLPCYPDTVEVIPQQILDADTSMVNGVPIVVYKVILCVPDGVDLDAGSRGR